MNKKKLMKIRKFIMIASSILLVGCILFLVYYLGIQPYYSKHVNNKYKELYYSSKVPSQSQEKELSSDDNPSAKTSYVGLDTSFEQGAKDENGVLLKFSKLLDINPDIVGWLKVPGTNIDYPVMQPKDDSDYYLKHDFEGTRDKNGCLYIQDISSIRPRSKNLVIHGHNMDSTGMMFHELLKYKDPNFYKKHPVITFDSLYNENRWKIIAYIRVSGNFQNSGSFNYMQSDFASKEEFLNFVYEIQLRSSYHCPVDINEKDSLLMLSTCSYEINDYRTVVVCRKLRKGESVDIDSNAVVINPTPLYPASWYKKYGGTAPLVTSFTDAMSFGEIQWYDGNLEIDSAIHSKIETDDAVYEILSDHSVSLDHIKDNKLQRFELPSTITLGQRPFDVTDISKSVFKDMKQLNYVKIGNNVESIPAKCFVSCKNLESVIIGDHVKTVGAKAFYKCNQLNYIKVRSHVLDTIEDQAFAKIRSNAKFKLPKKLYKNYQKKILSSASKDHYQFIKYEEETKQ